MDEQGERWKQPECLIDEGGEHAWVEERNQMAIVEALNVITVPLSRNINIKVAVTASKFHVLLDNNRDSRD